MEFIPLRLSEWAPEDRPREKLLQSGPKSLTDAELLSVLIGSGGAGRPVHEIARQVLDHCQNRLDTLASLNPGELQLIPGIGQARSLLITAALELGRRSRHKRREARKEVRSSRDAYEQLAEKMEALEHEEFHVLFLDRANRILKNELLSSGGSSGTVVDLKMLFRRSLQYKAHALIIAHNHPSGKLQPSRMDREITRKVAESARLLDMQLLDHLILSDASYFSFADEGLLT